MAGTYSQVYIQVVFAVNGRQNLISSNWKEDLNKYIAGIIKGKGHKSIIVNGMHDHIHTFIGLKPACAMIFPCGSETNDEPQNSIPAEFLSDFSNPIRLTAAI